MHFGCPTIAHSTITHWTIARKYPSCLTKKTIGHTINGQSTNAHKTVGQSTIALPITTIGQSIFSDNRPVRTLAHQTISQSTLGHQTISQSTIRIEKANVSSKACVPYHAPYNTKSSHGPFKRGLIKNNAIESFLAKNAFSHSQLRVFSEFMSFKWHWGMGKI